MPNKSRCPLDSGMIVVVFISLGYLVMVFGLLFYVKNEWCDLLFKNMTVDSQNIDIWIERSGAEMGHAQLTWAKCNKSFSFF